MANQNQESMIAQSQEEQQLQHAVDPAANLFFQAPCTPPSCCSCGSNNSMKRPSPSSSAAATLQGLSYGAATEHRASKKLFRDQQDLTLNGVPTISFPLRHGTIPATQNTKPLCPSATATPFHSPEHAHAVARASSSSPLPRSVKGSVSDPPPSPPKTFSRSSEWGGKGVILTKEEASDSMRMRRMKECLREMRKWWDEVMREEEEEGDPEGGAEGDKLLSKDDCRGDEEEAVSLEWADKCLSICFKCPCSKGYQILLSGNNCYYKLV